MVTLTPERCTGGKTGSPYKDPYTRAKTFLARVCLRRRRFPALCPILPTPPGSNTKPTAAAVRDHCCCDGYHPSVTGLAGGAGEVSKCW